MITGTIDCNTDEQASTACGTQKNLDMFKALTFMFFVFFYAGMKLNSDVVGSWLSLREHDVKQRAPLVKVSYSRSGPSVSLCETSVCRPQAMRAL